jgi:hypothetical protein
MTKENQAKAEEKKAAKKPKPLSKVKLVQITDQNRAACLKKIFKF